MTKTLYILDVDVFLDNGGAGKASYQIIKGLTDYYRIIFVPKYAAYNKMKASGYSGFLKDMDYMKMNGIIVPEKLLDLVSKTTISYNEYLKLISTIIEYESIVFDLNYFPELEPKSLRDIIKSFFYRGEINYLKYHNHCKIITLLQTLDNRPINSHTYFAFKSFINYHFVDLELLSKSIYRNVKDPISTKNLMEYSDLILLFSRGGIVSLNQKSDSKFRILNIGNTIENTIKRTPKSNYIVYFARLVYQKGILDLLETFNAILKSYDTILVIAGKFSDDKVKTVFYKRIKELGITSKIRMLGFIERGKLDEVISSAKVFIYPTHGDSFPYAILESISLSTIVVTYALPTISSIYSNLKCVTLIDEFDIDSMTKKTVEILKMGTNEYINIFNDEKIKEFIALHTCKDKSINEIQGYIEQLLT